MAMKRPVVRPPAALLVLFPALVISGCRFVERYTSGTLEDQLVEAAVARWATVGQPFFDGTPAGRDTVASVSPTGARAWEVAVLPLSGGAPVVWSFEVTRTEVYTAIPGDAFVRWLSDRARELGMRTFLPPDVADALRRGDILAAGDLEIRDGAADRSGRNTEERVAYLTPGAQGERAAWSIQSVSRSANVLLMALKTVVEDMVYRDDRVLTCMGSGTPRGIARSVQLECVGKVLTREFTAKPR